MDAAQKLKAAIEEIGLAYQEADTAGQAFVDAVDNNPMVSDKAYDVYMDALGDLYDVMTEYWPVIVAALKGEPRE